MNIRPALALVFLVCATDVRAADDGPLSESSSPQPVLPDPVPGRAPHFAPDTATASVAQADTGTVRKSQSDPGCTKLNPCARPTPSIRGAGPVSIATNR